MSSTYANPSTTAPIEAPPAARLIQMILGYQITQVVGAVARLGLADQLTAGPRSSAELIKATGAHPDGLTRLLRAAATAGLVTEDEPDRFALTSLGALLATDAQPASLRDIAIGAADPGLWLPCGRLFDTVMNGHPSAKAALGKELWEYCRDHPEEDAIFARAMGGLSASILSEVVACYDLTRFHRIVDIGGSQGVLLAGLLEAAPQATGVLFDRPEVIATAHPVLAARGLADRVELIGGDFFTEVPPDGDLYVLKSVLHDWDDSHVSQILANCHRAARPGSTLLLIEGLLPSASEPSTLHRHNLILLVYVGGRDRTREQYQALLEAAGYRLEQTISPQAGIHPAWSLLEAHRC